MKSVVTIAQDHIGSNSVGNLFHIIQINVKLSKN